MVGNLEAQPFSLTSTYVSLNREFVRAVLRRADPPTSVVDLACGDGLLTELLLDEFGLLRQTSWKLLPEHFALAVFGIDNSEDALAKAHRRLRSAINAESGPKASKVARPRIELAHAVGTAIPLAGATANLVLLGNAIHCFPEKPRVLSEVHRVLTPGGVFAFNTAFYAGTMVAGTEEFYGEWMKEAVRLLMSQGQHPRRRELGRGAFVNRWLSPDDYSRMLDSHGFQVMQVSERNVELSRADFLSLAADGTGSWEPGLVSVLLPGYPTLLACDALRQGVNVAFDVTRLSSVPRSWLEVICRRCDE